MSIIRKKKAWVQKCAIQSKQQSETGEAKNMEDDKCKAAAIRFNLVLMIIYEQILVAISV